MQGSTAAAASAAVLLREEVVVSTATPATPPAAPAVPTAAAAAAAAGGVAAPLAPRASTSPSPRASASAFAPASGATFGTNVYFVGSSDEYSVQMKLIDTSYLNLYGIKLLSGKNIIEEDTARHILVNETFVKHVNLNNQEIQFAGAHRPLFFIHDNLLTECKGTSRSIGGFHHNVFGDATFNNSIYPFNTGDSIIIFSDGIVDQLGGPEKKKYSTLRFRDLIVNSAHLPLNQIEKKLK